MTHIFIIFWLFCGVVKLISLSSENEENESDVPRITITDLPGDYSNNHGKEITLHGTFDEKITVFPKSSLFGKNFKVSECENVGCTSKKLSERQETKFNMCIFGGHINSDSDSKVNLIACNGNGAKDISIVSSKASFKSNLYRVSKTGKVNIATVTKFSDEIINEIMEDKTEEINFSDDSNIPAIDTFIDSKNRAVFVMDVNEECCRSARAGGQITQDGEEIFVANQKGIILCNKRNYKYTCQELKDYVKKKAKKQQKDDKIEVQKYSTTSETNGWVSIEYKKEENKVKHYQSKSEEVSQDSDEEYEKDIENKTTEYENISGEGKEGSDEEEYDEYEELNENYVNTKNIQSKNLRELSTSELVNMVKQINKPQNKAKKNPMCSRKLFRSATIISVGCGSDVCRMKEPIPKAKIYSERTVEFGVFVDSYAYKQIADEIVSSDNEKIKEAIVEMVHSLFIEAETYTTHSTFASFKGGFKFALNGIHIYKEVNDEETRKWEADRTLKSLLKSFAKFANKVNGACDADQNSFDGMVLLTGRGDKMDMDDANVERGSMRGYANTGSLCKINPVVVMTLRLDGKGSPQMATGRLLAHELGHLFGSDHDGQKATYNDVYKNQDRVPCPHGSHLMSKSVNGTMKTWSTCTQKMIDAEDQKREKEKKNCLFT